MFNLIFFDAFAMEQLVPSIIAFYNHLGDGYIVTENVVKSIKFFRALDDIYYLNNYNLYDVKLKRDNVFFDNGYWNFWIKSPRTYNNHFAWNYLNSNVHFNFNMYDYWISLYPTNVESFLWINNDNSLFRTRFYDYTKNIYDVYYVGPRNLQHHDYTNDIYICTNLFWQQFPSVTTVPPGFHFLWYENYGSVEIGLKFLYTYWYQLLYPELEYNITLEPSLVNNSYGIIKDYDYYVNGIQLMIVDLNNYNWKYVM